MKRVISLILAILLLVSAAVIAQAEDVPLRLGDKGANVKELQQLLVYFGFLDGKADGKFGAMTENAIDAFHWWIGADGSALEATSEDLATLRDLYDLATGTVGSEVDPETNAMPSCMPADVDWDTVYCWRHAGTQHALSYTTSGNPPAKLIRAMYLRAKENWLRDISAMYDEWAAVDPAIAKEQKAIYEQSLAEKQTAWKTAGKKLKEASAEELELLFEEVCWLEEMGVNLCYDLHGAEGNAY